MSLNPDDVARQLAHRDRSLRVDRHGTCPANGKDPAAVCVCRPTEDCLAEVWQGRARMAWSRKMAGVRLDAYDLQALDRYPTPRMTGAGA